jgi:hypothetical protein
VKAGIALFVVLGLGALGWNYWVSQRTPDLPRVPNSAGVFRGGGAGRGFGGPATTVSGSIRLAGGVSHSAHVELVRAPNGAPRRYDTFEALGDGRFAFPRVIADRYWVVARAEVDADPSRPGDGPTVAWFGAAEVVSDGQQPVTLSMQLHPAATVVGRFVLPRVSGDARGGVGLLNVGLTSADARTRAVVGGGGDLATSEINEDGTFTIQDVPAGRYRIEVSQTPWTLDAVVVAGRDRLDLPFQVGPAERLQASIVLTERPNQVEGTLRDPSGRARGFGMVALFAVDPDERDSFRRVHLVRADPRGLFQFHGMPSGEYFLAPAEGIAPPLWRTPEFFQHLTPVATRVTVGRGVRRTLDLRTTAPDVR